jgi:hypothetical protein
VTVYFDNPAGRLHRLLTAFQRAASSQPAHGAWATALVVPGNDLALLLRRLALVVELPAQIEAEIAKVDPDEFDQDAVMRWKGPLDPVLGPTLFGHEQSGVVADRIDSSALLSLEQCSFVLHRHRRQPGVIDSDIERLRSLLDDLRTEVEHNLDSELELRDFLLHHTQAMTEALDVLVISGRTPSRQQRIRLSVLRSAWHPRWRSAATLAARRGRSSAGSSWRPA